MDTQQCMQTRRTIRQYKETALTKEQIGMLIDAGRYAPSAGNLQNWRFIVVRNPSTKSKIADACVQQVWIEHAPVIMVIVSDLAQAEEFYGSRGKEVYSRHNAAAAAQNILLCAHDLGLAGAWIGAFDEEMLSRALSLPGNARAEAVLAIGHAAESVPIPPRYDPLAVVFWDSWGNKEMNKPGPKVEGIVKNKSTAIEKLQKLVSK